MERKIKKSTIVLGVALFIFFMVGYTIGIIREKQNLINICSENLEIDPSRIKSVKYKDNSLIINLKDMNQKLSVEDRTIYEVFEPELVWNLRDAVKKENICIR